MSLTCPLWFATAAGCAMFVAIVSLCCESDGRCSEGSGASLCPRALDLRGLPLWSRLRPHRRVGSDGRAVAWRSLRSHLSLPCSSLALSVCSGMRDAKAEAPRCSVSSRLLCSSLHCDHSASRSAAARNTEHTHSDASATHNTTREKNEATPRAEPSSHGGDPAAIFGKFEAVVQQGNTGYVRSKVCNKFCLILSSLYARSQSLELSARLSSACPKSCKNLIDSSETRNLISFLLYAKLISHYSLMFPPGRVELLLLCLSSFVFCLSLLLRRSFLRRRSRLASRLLLLPAAPLRFAASLCHERGELHTDTPHTTDARC